MHEREELMNGSLKQALDDLKRRVNEPMVVIKANHWREVCLQKWRHSFLDSWMWDCLSGLESEDLSHLKLSNLQKD